MTYQPHHISGNSTGLVQSRQNFLLTEDAYPSLVNAFIFREQIRRKQGVLFLARLQRSLTAASIGEISAVGAGTFIFNIRDGLIGAGSITVAETNAEFVPLNLSIVIPAVQTLTDASGTGQLTITGVGPITAAILSYSTGNLILTFSGVLAPTVSNITGDYYPGLPVMGLRIEELQNSSFNNTIAFDTVYAYTYSSSLEIWQEFEPGTTWTGANYEFFWSTNYWVGVNNFKIFWVNNNHDPIRFTNGQQFAGWFDFTPIINAGGGTLTNALCLLPFRGRFVAFNVTQAGSDGGIFTNRIRWSAIGTPFTQAYTSVTSPFNPIVTSFNATAWRDDIKGQGGFLDIPTSEDIVSVGFVRDNCVIYCERSTWQLRYTGKSIDPFQIEKVNSELGAESTFSTVQFDTSLVGVGDKGIVECDSYKSQRIDVKIPDLVFSFSNSNNGIRRVHGIRDFVSKLAYFTYPSEDSLGTFPDNVLVYNYDNDSWAIFTDSFTCFGQFQLVSDRTWLNTDFTWKEANFNWKDEPLGDPAILAGNQQGFVLQLSNQIDGRTDNDVSLSITNITPHAATDQPTVITVPNHNLKTGAVILITQIITATAFANLNNGVFGVVYVDDNNLELQIYNPSNGQFTINQIDQITTPYIGLGKVSVIDNFSVVSKKFNFLDQGQSIQFGYLDLLMNNAAGAISVNVYADYDDNETTNTLPQNEIDSGVGVGQPDLFFNSVVSTSKSPYSNLNGSKFWQRVVCPTRANFVTLEYTFSNAQLAAGLFTTDVQIDSQILYMRPAGRITQPY